MNEIKNKRREELVRNSSDLKICHIYNKNGRSHTTETLCRRKWKCTKKNSQEFQKHQIQHVYVYIILIETYYYVQKYVEIMKNIFV